LTYPEKFSNYHGRRQDAIGFKISFAGQTKVPGLQDVPELLRGPVLVLPGRKDLRQEKEALDPGANSPV
jgi:hypothetical protein